MERQVYNVTYNGIDKENRIDCLAQIRREQNPSGHTTLDIEGLRKGSRSTREDANRPGLPPREKGKFVKLDGLFDKDLEIIEKKEESKKKAFRDGLKVDVEPVDAKNISDNGNNNKKDLGRE